MKRVLEENETSTQTVNDAGRPSAGVSPIYKPKLSSINPANKIQSTHNNIYIYIMYTIYLDPVTLCGDSLIVG